LNGAERARHVARSFSARRAKQLATEIWQEARGQDTPAIWRAARVAARHLREAGIEDVRLEEVPSDGRTSCAGWLMPPAWQVSSARLETVAPRGVLADAAAIPLALAQYSPSTPGGNWVEGPVWQLPAAAENDRRPLVERARSHAKAVAGRFILLPAGKPDPALNRWAAAQGALAILSIHPGPARHAAQYLNYAVPLDMDSPCIPVFALTHSAGKALLAHIRTPGATLRARVKARRYAGSVPMLTGSLGNGMPALYVCAHIDEIGAQDNASGCAVAIEALRTLRERAGTELKRQIRFYFSTEVRGQQWWFNHSEKPDRFLGGINIDMAGADLVRESGLMQVLTGFRHRPHFAGRVVVEAARTADALVGKMNIRPGANYASDALPGLTAAGGHVSIEQKTGPTYHTSDDTPRILSLRTLRWSGAAATAFLHRMSCFDNQDLLRWTRTIRPDETQPEPAIRTARLAAELRTLRKAFALPNIYPALVTPDALHAAGVSRTTGLWPAYADLQRLKALLADKGMNAPAPATAPAATRQSLVPLATAKGLLSFEDHTSPAEIAALKRHLDLRPGWGTEGWISMLYSCCDGKHTLEELVCSLQSLGVRIELPKAQKVIRYLADRKLVRLRPVLTPAEFRAALRKAGVRRGSILTVHSSLSRFGYLPGGPAAMVQALLDVLGPRGTLVLPTHSNCVLGTPPYDPLTSPSNTGAVTEYFRKLPGVVRGAHPTHSVAALGPRAVELTSAQRADRTPMDREGFWGRLCDLGGDVLLLCPIRSATVFHAGEAWLGLPQRNLIAHTLDANGKRRVYVLPNSPWHVDHFEEHLARPLIRRKIMTVTPLGDSEMFLAPAKAMAEISVDRLKRHPELCLGKKGACNCVNCQALREGLKQKALQRSRR
jgi:aminoglycoside 3-N-acetyltransferase